MKNFVRKIVGMGLTVSMAAAILAGCGTKTDKATSGEKVFYIGGSGPLTGSYAAYGMGVKNGAELAVKEINEAGGINGVKIKFSYEDDEGDQEKAVNAYNILKDKGMNIMMGTVTSNACAAVIEKTNQDGMFQITPSASSTDVLKYGNVFQVCFTDPNQGIASAKYIGEIGLAKKVAIIYDSSDIYSSGIQATFKEEAQKQGLEIVADEAFTSDNKTDFSVQLQKAKDGGAELVFLPIYYQEASLILQQAASMDYKPIFFGCDGLDGILNVENFDTSLAEGVILLSPFAAVEGIDDQTTKFVQDYKAAYGELPNQFAADAYDAIYIIKAAIEQSGVKPDMSVKELGDALKAAMLKIKVDGLTGKEMTWSSTGEVNKQPRVYKVVNGKYAVAE